MSDHSFAEYYYSANEFDHMNNFCTPNFVRIFCNNASGMAIVIFSYWWNCYIMI